MTKQSFPKLTDAAQTLQEWAVQFPLGPIRLKMHPVILELGGVQGHLRTSHDLSVAQHPLLVSSLPLCRWSGPLSATWMAVWASVFWVFSISIVSLNSANSDSCGETIIERDDGRTKDCFFRGNVWNQHKSCVTGNKYFKSTRWQSFQWTRMRDKNQGGRGKKTGVSRWICPQTQHHLLGKKKEKRLYSLEPTRSDKGSLPFWLGRKSTEGCR